MGFMLILWLLLCYQCLGLLACDRNIGSNMQIGAGVVYDVHQGCYHMLEGESSIFHVILNDSEFDFVFIAIFSNNLIIID